MKKAKPLLSFPQGNNIKMKNHWFAEAEALKTQILDQLERMSPEDRRLSIGPRAWSAAQVVGHLVQVEELLVNDWRDAAKKSPRRKPGRRGTLIVNMVNFAMTTRLRLPTRDFLEPTGSMEFSDLADRWRTARKRLPLTFPPDASALWIIHPLFGPLSCEQMGRFLVAHLRHHLKHWPGKIPESATTRTTVET